LLKLYHIGGVMECGRSWVRASIGSNQSL